MVGQRQDDDWAWVDDDESDWVPPTIDTSKPSVARIYDYLIGGKDNFAVDREAAAQLALAIPGVADAAQANRTFMLRSVQAMTEAGIDQFLDLGTGIPTSPNLHETARLVHPNATAVYVDNDPIVMSHNRALLATDERVLTVPHDLRDPASVLDDPQVRGLLDFDRPIGLLMIAVLHFVDLGSAPVIASRYYRQLAPGSQVAISAGTRDGVPEEAVASAERVYAASSAPFVFRTHAQVEQLFDGLRLEAPGVHDVYRSDHGRIIGGRAVK